MVGPNSKRRLPKSVSLPSGRRVELDDPRARKAAAAATGSLLARTFAVLSAPGVVRSRGKTLGADDLSLRDAHALRAMLGWAGVVEEPEVPVVCDNCGATLRVKPAERLEIGPFLDGELDDEELDAPFDFDADHATLPVFTSGGARSAVRLAPRSLADAEALFTRSDTPLRVTRAIVSAMGIVALGNERRASHIARALAKTDDAAWEEICALYDQAHYSPRLFGTLRCDCGAAVRVSAPVSHELFGSPDPTHLQPRARMGRSLDLEAFRRMVAAAAEGIVEKRRVRGLSICVDEGVPLCDDGGEPLLGCYTPAHTDPDTLVESEAEVLLFYRTFAHELRTVDGFDLEGEISTTVDHEVQHHLFALSGHDPIDEEERAEIARFEERVVGQREVVRRGLRSGFSDMGRFVRIGWPLFAIAFIAAALKYCAD